MSQTAINADPANFVPRLVNALAHPRSLPRKLLRKLKERFPFVARSAAAVKQHGASSADIPQASIVDHALREIRLSDWRTYFSSKLLGSGLEIGPLHRPLPRHDLQKVAYIDRYTVAQLRAHYPELNDLPLVELDLIGDAETLAVVPDCSYDFLTSAHVIEHMKNPIGALEQWCRVLRPGGKLYLIVPDKRAIFDRPRVRTTLEHMVLDYRRPSNERDFEHCLDYAIHVH